MLVLYSAGRDSITRHVHHWHSISALSHEMTTLPTSISSLDVMIPYPPFFPLPSLRLQSSAARHYSTGTLSLRLPMSAMYAKMSSYPSSIKHKEWEKFLNEFNLQIDGLTKKIAPTRLNLPLLIQEDTNKPATDYHLVLVRRQIMVPTYSKIMLTMMSALLICLMCVHSTNFNVPHNNPHARSS